MNDIGTERICPLEPLPVEPVRWIGGPDGYLRILDQTRLPGEVAYLECREVATVWEAIRSLRVRGAPAIGIAAAYGVCLGLGGSCSSTSELLRQVEEHANYLATARPTAVNLFWALERMKKRAEALADSPPFEFRSALLEEAFAIHREDRQMCEAIGRWGASLIPTSARILTHCNTGALATGGIGTALGVIYTAFLQGKKVHVYADETRPLLQGARLTMWELLQWGVPATVICDSMAAVLMRQGKVELVLVGADRIAANGDTANKIGTYNLAVVARRHGVPFYVAAPSSTFDLSLPTGDSIPIEERPPEEVLCPLGLRIAPEGASAWNPAFDVTPAELITAIICEKGIIQPVQPETIASTLAGQSPS